MPQVANVTLTGTSPASVTYSVDGRAPDQTSFVDRRRLLPALFGSMTKTVKKIRDAQRRLTGAYRVVGKISEPIVRTVDGQDVVVDYNIIEINARMSSVATLTEKQHTRKLAESYILSSSFIASLETGEQDY